MTQPGNSAAVVTQPCTHLHISQHAGSTKGDNAAPERLSSKRVRAEWVLALVVSRVRTIVAGHARGQVGSGSRSVIEFRIGQLRGCSGCRLHRCVACRHVGYRGRCLGDHDVRVYTLNLLVDNTSTFVRQSPHGESQV